MDSSDEWGDGVWNEFDVNYAFGILSRSIVPVPATNRFRSRYPYSTPYDPTAGPNSDRARTLLEPENDPYSALGQFELNS